MALPAVALFAFYRTLHGYRLAFTCYLCGLQRFKQHAAPAYTVCSALFTARGAYRSGLTGTLVSYSWTYARGCAGRSPARIPIGYTGRLFVLFGRLVLTGAAQQPADYCARERLMDRSACNTRHGLAAFGPHVALPVVKHHSLTGVGTAQQLLPSRGTPCSARAVTPHYTTPTATDGPGPGQPCHTTTRLYPFVRRSTDGSQF